MEPLETRQLLAANLFLDFGEAFAYDADVGDYQFDVDKQILQQLNPGWSYDDTPDTLNSLRDNLGLRGIDYNDDGQFNSTDVQRLRDDVLRLVRRAFEPFEVNVQVAASRDMHDVAGYLNNGAGNDSYIFVSGARKPSTSGLGHAYDNIGFAFASNLIDQVGGERELIPFSLARTAAHEAGHTFGLDHLRSSSEGLTDDQQQLMSGDLMHISGSDRFEQQSLFSRWTFPRSGGGQQNAYWQLAFALGLNAFSPSFVSGTGAHDRIVVTSQGNSTARVQIDAYRDEGLQPNDLITSLSYTINTTYGVVVEGGVGDDYITVVDVTSPVTIRGGDGNDRLVGTAGNNVLEGDRGDDILAGHSGNDTYIFAGSQWLHLGSDIINDTAGAYDSLNFLDAGWAVDVDLAAIGMQAVERQFASPGAIATGSLYYASFVQPYAPGNNLFDSHLNLHFYETTSIEVVYGSQFNDILRGNAANNYLLGNEGHDLLEGRGGNDVTWGGNGNDVYTYNGASLGSDSIIELTNGGIDQLDFRNFGQAININLADSNWQVVSPGHLSLNLPYQTPLEWVYGSQFDDQIRGNSLANRLLGFGGNDKIWGGAGNDFIRGGAGNDQLRGQDGLDFILGDAGNDLLDGGYDGDEDYLAGGSGQDIFVQYYRNGQYADDEDFLADFRINEDSTQAAHIWVFTARRLVAWW